MDALVDQISSSTTTTQTLEPVPASVDSTQTTQEVSGSGSFAAQTTFHSSRCGQKGRERSIYRNPGFRWEAGLPVMFHSWDFQVYRRSWSPTSSHPRMDSSPGIESVASS